MFWVKMYLLLFGLVLDATVRRRRGATPTRRFGAWPKVVGLVSILVWRRGAGAADHDDAGQYVRIPGRVVVETTAIMRLGDLKPCVVSGCSRSSDADGRAVDGARRSEGAAIPKLAARKNPVPSTPASITAGRALYSKNCRHCHGLRGLGDGPLAPKNPKPANLTDAKWDHGVSDGEIFTVIWNGAPAPKSEMKPMKGTLTEKNSGRSSTTSAASVRSPAPAAKAGRARNPPLADTVRTAPRLSALVFAGSLGCRLLEHRAARPRPLRSCRGRATASSPPPGRRSARRSTTSSTGGPTRCSRSSFPHNIHAGKQIACTEYCHEAVTTGPVAGLPSVRTCMVCHNTIATDRPRIKLITAMREQGRGPGLAARVRLHASRRT